MFRLFQKKRPALESPSAPLQGLMLAQPAQRLLAGHQPLLNRIQSLVGVPGTHWQKLYQAMFESYALFVQQLPASESHHHCEPGGLLRHGLEVVHEALRLRRGVLLPVGADAEDLARLQDVWTYGCVTAALLHDLGKPLTDQQVQLFDAAGKELGEWRAITGQMPAGIAYLPRFRTGRRYHQHERLAPLLAHWVVPAEGLSWMSAEPDLMDAWMCAIQADWDNAGVLGDLVSKADATSSAQDLAGGGRIQLATARAKPLSMRLLQTLKHLLDEDQIPLNRRGAAGFVTADALWLVSKRVLDQVRDQMGRDGQTGIPSRNDRLMDELQQHGMILPCNDKAIWTCRVSEGDWSAELTLLKMDLGKVWGDASRRPEPWAGQIVPVDATVPTDEPGVVPEQPQAVALPPDATYAPPPVPASVPEPLPSTALDDLPLPFDLPSEPVVRPQVDPVEDEGQAAPVAEVPAAAPSHENPFAAWLQDAIRSGREEINTPKARMHVIPEGLFLVSPGIFKDYSLTEWSNAQKHFMRLKLNLKRPDGTNVWTVAVSKPETGRRTSTLKGILIPDAATKLQVTLPAANPTLKLVREPVGE